MSNSTNEDFIIAGEGMNRWAVISRSGEFRVNDECPCVVYSGLESRESAEVALKETLSRMSDVFLSASPISMLGSGPIDFRRAA